MGIVEEGVRNIRDILRQVRGIGAILAGPGDMSVSMGLRGQASHPAVQENLLRVLAACKAFGVPCATGARSASVIDRLLKDQNPLENRNNLRTDVREPRRNFAVRNSSSRPVEARTIPDSYFPSTGSAFTQTSRSAVGGYATPRFCGLE
jgi:hypothetical protein